MNLSKLTLSVPRRYAVSAAGFSMIELMLAMLLGIFLIAGVGSVYLSSKQTYSARNQMSELDENARVALNALKEHIEHAGYASLSGQPVSNYVLPTGFVPTAASCPKAGNTSVVNTTLIKSSRNGTTTDSVGGDSIGVAYLADMRLATDCSNSSWVNRCLPDDATDLTGVSQAARLVYNSFWVQNHATRKNSINDTIPELLCGGSLNLLSQPWAQGIENMQLRYGVDTSPDPVPVGQKKQWEVDQYLDASQVATSNAWDKIAVVQVALLVRSIEPAFTDSQAMSYQLFDQAITTNDRYKRAVYTTTIHLRNIAR